MWIAYKIGMNATPTKEMTMHLVFSENVDSYTVSFLASFDNADAARDYIESECFSPYKRYWIECQAAGCRDD